MALCGPRNLASSSNSIYSGFLRRMKYFVMNIQLQHYASKQPGLIMLNCLHSVDIRDVYTFIDNPAYFVVVFYSPSLSNKSWVGMKDTVMWRTRNISNKNKTIPSNKKITYQQNHQRRQGHIHKQIQKELLQRRRRRQQQRQRRQLVHLHKMLNSNHM